MRKMLTIGDARIHRQASESSRTVQLQYTSQRSTIISTCRVTVLTASSAGESGKNISRSRFEHKSALTHSPFPPLSWHKLSLLKVQEDPKRTAYKKKVAYIEKKAVPCFRNDLLRKLRDSWHFGRLVG